ncbi:hypothetical protein AX774_g5544 [Zancudomyces culisetae]|uniref:Uncharacterized protein n=1 Tax=Zancudomyces culisetae TaxID=1213189 RepID=A0A1R1PJ74_ZANCU|nr:hypothetical protein AX774_g5544 [Zancudomyces culisetae]|eukprot:OMH81007.1 hypothetical protein AX774_g5544 [Zancudomyces culisetae]
MDDGGFKSPTTRMPLKRTTPNKPRSSELLKAREKRRELEEKIKALKSKIGLLKTAISLVEKVCVLDVFLLELWLENDKKTGESTKRWRETFVTLSLKLYELLEPNLSIEYQKAQEKERNCVKNDEAYRDPHIRPTSEEHNSCSDDENTTEALSVDEENFLFNYMLKSLGIDPGIMR